MIATSLTQSPARSRLLLPLAWVFLGLLLLIHLPPFLCLGLVFDTCIYDFQASLVLRGQVLYRDCLEPNFPGIVWLQAVIRSVLGWRSEVLRAVDAGIVAMAIVLLVRWLPRTMPAWARVGTAGILTAFYLGSNEWCHCQRDTWMLAPALLGLALRARQIERVSDHATPTSTLTGWAFVEGLIWGAAVWIKPHVVLPALAAESVAVWRGWRVSPGEPGKLLADFAGLVSGGLVSGAAGVGWLVAYGAWPAFQEVIFSWNRDYFLQDTTGELGWLVHAGTLVRFFPWCLVTFMAVPIALEAVGRECHRQASAEGPSEIESVSPLLAAFYLAWLAQVLLLQHKFDYVQVPLYLLGITLVAAYAARASTALLVGFFVVCIAVGYPALTWQRLQVWPRCFSEGSTAELRDRLRIYSGQAEWTRLTNVANYLRAQQVGDGEVTVFNLSLIALHQMLDRQPATRYVILYDYLYGYARQREQIQAEVAASPQHFVVCDLSRNGMSLMRAQLGESATGCSNDSYPWAKRVVFRDGNYVVFRLSGAEMPAWLSFHCPFQATTPIALSEPHT